MKGKIVKYSVSVAVLATMLQATPSFASSPVTLGQISATQGQINNFQTKVFQLDNQISLAMIKSQQLSDAIKTQQAKIEESKAEIEKAQTDLDTHKQVYFERLRSYQAQNQEPIVTYAELLLSSQSISEFLTRSTAITQILQSDSDLMTALYDKEQALNNAQQELHNELDNLSQSQAELAAQQQQIQAAKQEVETQLAASKNTLQQQKSQLAQQSAPPVAQQQTQQQSPSITNSIPALMASVPAPQANSSLANQVIATAEQYLGTPYVWGGTSPSGFDCSGLMQYVFHAVGVSLPRTAAAQQNVGIRISPNQVQPGDLIFMGYPAYHVGMYIGNGEWIESPETGDVVKIVPYNPSMFSSAARVLP